MPEVDKTPLQSRTKVSSQIPIGSVLDETYAITGYLGQGGMCTLYQARHLQIDRATAIKVLNLDQFGDANAIKRFQREAKAISSLSHPNVVRVFGFGVVNSQPYMAMELLEGISLAQLIEKRGAIPIAEAMPIFMQILDALEYVHNQGIVHRDIKPSNVMLVDDGKVAKLLDFGIAQIALPERQAQKLTKTHAILGSLAYISPEQCMGQPADVRSDIYSMGCLMYEVLSSKPPFVSESAFSVMHRKVMATPSKHALPRDPRCGVILGALRRNPDERPQTVAELKAQLLEPAVRNGPFKIPLYVKLIITTAIMLGAAYYISKQGQPIRISSRHQPPSNAARAKSEIRPQSELIELRRRIDRGDFALAQTQINNPDYLTRFAAVMCLAHWSPQPVTRLEYSEQLYQW